VPQTSIDKMMETGPNAKNSVKIFPSQAAPIGSFKEEKGGFLLQMNYRPHTTEDTDVFYSTTQDFCSNEYLTIPFYGAAYPQAELDNFEGDGPEVADARGRF